MGSRLGAAILLLGAESLGAQVAAPPIIELRIAVAAPTPGYLPRRLADSTFHVSEQVLISDGDVVRARPSREQGHLNILAIVTPQAATRLEAGTRDRLGDRIAVFFNGVFTAAVPIVGPVTGPTLILEAMGSPEGDRLADQVRNRWPSSP
ncbi:MAG: hypothetical protein KC544_15135 [Gemmatimonadetes bacterium]|nr:hypothetical protein [Gemmatimonadota bacterium]